MALLIYSRWIIFQKLCRAGWRRREKSEKGSDVGITPLASLLLLSVSLLIFNTDSFALERADVEKESPAPPRSRVTPQFSPNKLLRFGILDLHGLTKKKARGEVINYIKLAFKNSRKKCRIMTGKGTHVNSSGTRGVLRAKFPEWASEPELIPLIKSYQFDEINGTYVIELHNNKTRKRTKVYPTKTQGGSTVK